MKKFFKLLAVIMSFIFAGSLQTVSAEHTDAEKNDIAYLLGLSQTAKKTNQIILVIDHNLSFWNKGADGEWVQDFDTYCGYGRNGFIWPEDRYAGTNTTPIGSFPILYAFGKADNPGTSMEYRKIKPTSYLSAESSTYNTWQESYRAMSGEHLIDYYQYKYAMNIGFNINPTVVGRGSAIFLHCKSYDRWYTAGCVSVPEDVMRDLIVKSRDGVYMIIVPKFEDIQNF